MKFMDALELFLEHLEAIGRSPKTIEVYKGHLTRVNNHLSMKYNRSLDVDEVNADDFEKYLFEPPHDKKFAQMTRLGITIAFKSFYSFCYHKGYCKTDIGKKVVQVKARAKERGFITEDELFRIIDCMAKERDKVLFQTLFYAGLRIGEAIDLTFDDINFEDNYIYIRKHKSRYDRKIPISIKLGFILENYLEHHRNEIDTKSDKVFLFQYSDGTNIKSYLNNLLKEATQKAGLNVHITSHIMRHSFASNLIEKGVDIVKVQKLLGHKSIRTTSIYLHTNMKALKKAVSTL